MNVSFITCRTQKLRLQKIMVKTTLSYNRFRSAILSVIVYCSPLIGRAREMTLERTLLRIGVLGPKNSFA